MENLSDGFEKRYEWNCSNALNGAYLGCKNLKLTQYFRPSPAAWRFSRRSTKRSPRNRLVSMAGAATLN